MNTHKKAASIISALAGFIFIMAFDAGAQPPPFGGGGDGKHDEFMEKMMKKREQQIDEMMAKLGLSPAQSEKIKALRAQEQEEERAAREKADAYHRELREELEKYDSDKTKVYALLDKLDPMMHAMFRRKIDSIMAVKEVLTREQFASLQAEMKAQRDKDFRHMRTMMQKEEHAPAK